jgi:hypothetical protein
MYAGPGIILVAKDANIAIDESGGRRGLVYTQKGLLVGSNRDLLRHAFRAALKNCRKLEEEPALSGKLRFAANEAVISLNDRLLGDNTRESFESIEGDVELVSTQLFGGTAAKLERDNDPRQRLNFHVKTSALVSVAQALENLSRN